MASEGQHFNPAESVTEPGIYRCTKCSYTQFFTPDVKGLSFPQDHYTLAKWELVEKMAKPGKRLIGRSRTAQKRSYLGFAMKSLRLLGRTLHPA